MSCLQLGDHILQLGVILKVRPSETSEIVRRYWVAQNKSLEAGVLSQSLPSTFSYRHEEWHLCGRLTSSTSFRPTVFGIDLKKSCDLPGSKRFSTGRNTL